MRKRNGETSLIEILMVIVIIAMILTVLVAMTIPSTRINSHEYWTKKCNRTLSVAHTLKDSVTLFREYPTCLDFSDTTNTK